MDKQVLLHGRLAFMVHGGDQTSLLEPQVKRSSLWGQSTAALLAASICPLLLQVKLGLQFTLNSSLPPY